ncbi:hypothetical protein Bpfe_021249 [Biomphalaria pfeifferi]|uniref:Uncharacterized protein n=1 Tax=Biomphalaria pfeifferi TaxID=112525 RepID=A0AAD8B7F6_BIOPF|nr:hypothetical protein Bpfe_021249 [Biomphalaria pfeifferi]
MTSTTDIIGEAIALAEKLNIPSHERERWFNNKLDNEDIKAEVEHFTSLATIPEEEEEETSSTPIPEIDVSLRALNHIDIPKVITLDDIALQKVKDSKVFTDHAEFFTSVSETFPVLQFESNSESNNIDNTKFHPPSIQRATFSSERNK